MFAIQWDSLHNSLWLPVLAIILMIYLYGCYKITLVIKQLGHTRYAVLISHFSMVRVFLKSICMTIVCCALGLALLSPMVRREKEQIKQEGHNLLVALDVSRSMAATDCMPSRLSCAKEKIKRLVNQLQSDRIGLILFAGTAFVYCPLTTDYDTFFQLLDSVDLQTISSTNTALDQPIWCSLAAFEKSNANYKLLILVTDGEDFGNNIEAAIQKAREQQLCICVLGIGSTEGSPIPIYNNKGQHVGHQKDKDQKIVISALHEMMLKKLATDMGGIYHMASTDDHDLDAFVRFIAQRSKESLGNITGEFKEFYYHYCLFVALCALLIEWFL